MIFKEEDLSKLAAMVDLNDSVILNYLLILKHMILPPEEAKKVHIFSCYIFDKLLYNVGKMDVSL